MEGKERIWIEKTPANAYCFGLFLESFSNGKVIHITRNPYDTIASLVSRGFSVYYATGVYLLNTAAALVNRDNPNCHLIKYENLISEPVNSIKALCQFLDVPFEIDMLASKNEDIEHSQLSGWKYDETASIGKSSVGRFDRLNKKSQSEIISAIQSIGISNKGNKYYSMNTKSISDCAELLNFPMDKLFEQNKRDFYTALINDRYERLKRGYKTGLIYPLEIVK